MCARADECELIFAQARMSVSLCLRARARMCARVRARADQCCRSRRRRRARRRRRRSPCRRGGAVSRPAKRQTEPTHAARSPHRPSLARDCSPCCCCRCCRCRRRRRRRCCCFRRRRRRRRRRYYYYYTQEHMHTHSLCFALSPLLPSLSRVRMHTSAGISTARICIDDSELCRGLGPTSASLPRPPAKHAHEPPPPCVCRSCGHVCARAYTCRRCVRACCRRRVGGAPGRGG